MPELAELERIIAPEVEAEGLSLVRVRMIGGASDPTLQVMAERPDTRQLALADCERLSRRLSDRFDELEAAGTDPIGHSYRLEVSSPGIDRPLTRRQDFEDWKGHEARVALAEKLDGRKQFTGTLIGAEGDDMILDVPGTGPRRLPLGAIHSAKLLLTDKLIRATAPLSADGADQIKLEGQE